MLSIPSSPSSCRFGLRPAMSLPALLLVVITSANLAAADWITAPSTYTHEPLQGERVAQYSPIGPFYYYQRADYLKSGYRHYRSTIQIGNSADNYHQVEEWGRPVRPYEEWRFPYRPYSVPYQQWGPPFGGLGGGGGFIGPYPYGGGGFGGGGGAYNNGMPYGAVPPNANVVPQQWMDGHYPSYNQRDRSDYYRPYRPE